MRYSGMNIKLIPGLLLFIAIIHACGSGEKTGTTSKKKDFPVRRDTPAQILQTVGKIIRYGRGDMLNRLYTAKSIKALKYNMTAGIGSAGTIDGFIREEISLWHARSGARTAMGKAVQKDSRRHRTVRRKRSVRKTRVDNRRPGIKKRGVSKTKGIRTKVVFTPPQVLHVRNTLYLVKWPSGTRFPMLFVKNGKGKWLIDVLNGPGGKILLLRK